jgi:hypothetical protein
MECVIVSSMFENKLEDWLRTEIPRRCLEADAHPEDMLSVEEMRRAIQDEIDSIQIQAGRIA